MKNIAILALQESTASVIHGMYDLFRSAGRDWGYFTEGVPGKELLKPVIVARRAGPLQVFNEVMVGVQAGMDDIGVPDVICIPDLAISPAEPLDDRFDEEIAWLKSCHAAGSIIATACSGSVLLAATRLLDGHEATSHWAYCDAIKRDYPKVQVREQRALVTTGEGHRLVMAGGGTTWLDMALLIIARMASIDAAMQVAKLNLINWHDVGQQPFARLAQTRQVEDAEIARCQAWIADHYAEPSPVAAMMEMTGLAERTFKRRFELATGMAPLAYVQTLRLEEAKHMLESGDAPVEAIANAVGYEYAAFFSRLFRRSVNLTPAEYRKRFKSLRTALSA